MALSPQYGWAEPDNSSLVKNGASDIRTLGDAIDTSLWNVGFGQAGKNKIINGDFGIWQRGTTFNSAADLSFSADRFAISYNGSATRNITRQTFTPATAPVAGYEGQYFLRFDQTVAGSGATANRFFQRIEDVRTFAGQTATFSFWAKAASSITLPALNLVQNFGSGGSAGVQTSVTTSIAVTTSWQRFTYTVAVPSISGKTVGTSSYLEVRFELPINSTFTFDIWGVQAEYGSKATPFQTATGTLQGELAACQRYYYRLTGSSAGYFSLDQSAAARQTTIADELFVLPVTMRTIPTAIEYGGTQYLETNYGSGAQKTITSITLDTPSSTSRVGVQLAVASGLTAGTRYIWYFANNSSAYFGVSAEL